MFTEYIYKMRDREQDELEVFFTMRRLFRNVRCALTYVVGMNRDIVLSSEEYFHGYKLYKNGMFTYIP
jgi:hypothetical protein